MPDPDDPRFAASPIAPAQEVAAPSADPPAEAPPAPAADSQPPPQQAAGAPAAGPDPFAAAADQVAGAHKAVLAATLRVASQSSPDEAARTFATADKTGIPAEVVARERQASEAVAKGQEAPELLARHPELAQWLTDPAHAAVAHDDLPTLKALDHVLHALGQGDGDPSGILAPGFVFDRHGQVLEIIPQGEDGKQANTIGSLEDYAREMQRRGQNQIADDVNRQLAAQRYGGLTYAGRLAATFVGGLQGGRGTMGADTVNSLDAMGRAFPDEANGLPSQLASFGGQMVSQFPEFLLGGELGVTAKALYEVSRAQRLISATAGLRVAAWAGKGLETAAVMAPMNAEQAVAVGKDQGAAAGVADFLASSGIVGATGPVGAARALVSPLERATVARGWMPAIQGIMRDAGLMGTQNAALVLSQALERRVLGDGKPLDAQDLFQQMGQAGELGAVAGSLFALGPEVAGKYHRDAASAMGGLEFGDKLQMALRLVQGSKLAPRSPEAMRSAIEASLGNGAGERNVYLQGSDWQEHWNTQGVDPVAKARDAGVLDRYVEAQATRGQMSVPISAYLQAVADSKTPEGILGKTRAAPGGMSPEEGAAFHQQAPADIQKLYEQAAQADTNHAAAADSSPAVQAIYEDAKAQIGAARPHWPEATLDAVARVYSRTLAGIARFSTPEGAPAIDPQTLHANITIGSELPESVRSKGYDAIRTLMERIQSGEGAADPATEQAMSDLAAHAEVIGGVADAHTLASVGDLMRGETGRATGATGGGQATTPELARRLDDVAAAIKAGGKPDPAAMRDLAADVLARPQRVIDADIPWAGATNRDGSVVYRDRRVPPTLDVGGVQIDTGRMLSVHELAEKQLLDRGIPYHQAHEAAEIAEHTALPAGVDPKAYEAAWQPYIDRALKESDPTKVPADIDPGQEPDRRAKVADAIRRYEGGERYDQALQAPRNDSLEHRDLLRQWQKAHGDRAPDRGSAEWDALVQQAAAVDRENGKSYEQTRRGSYAPGPDGKSRITLGTHADPSTVVHELGHYALDTLTEFAGRENAPAQLKRDMQALMDHMGVKDLSTWQGMDFEARRAAHEKFAESFESYFMEGKAPSAELRGVFRKIRNLMVAIYRTIKPLVTLSPAVRDVFDRLLAADSEIAAAREEMVAKPIFRTAEEAGMDPETFAAYLKDAAAENEQDRSRLHDKTMTDVARRLTDNWQEEQTRVRGDMEAVVNGRPEFKAMLALQKGEWPEGTQPKDFTGALKLDRADLVAKYGEEALKDLPGRAGFSTNPNRGTPLYAHEGGVPLDVAAAGLGFRSGDELWKALTEATNRTMAIDKMTAAEMRRRHPDADLEAAAQDVLHGPASGKRILRELDSLAKPVGEAPPPIEVLRQVAERTIAGRDVRSLNSLPEVYRRAEARAAREVLEALAKQDKRGAYEAQLRRVLNGEMFKAASEARNQIQGAADEMRKYNVGRVREILGKAGGWEWQAFQPDGNPFLGKDGRPLTFTSDADAQRFAKDNGNAPYLRTSSYLGQIDALRERFGFLKGRVPGYRETLTAWIADEQARGSEVVIPDWIAQTGDRIAWKDLSYEKFRDVVDAVQNIEHMARARNKLGEAMGKAMLAERVDQLATVSNENKQRIRKRSTAKGVVDRAADLVASADAALTRLSTQVHIMDGLKDGGVWWDTFVRPLQECANEKARMNAADAVAMHELVKAAGFDDQSGRLWKREYIAEIDDHLSHMSRLMVAAYWGRQEGRERLLTAHWTEDQVQRLVLDKLDAKDRDFLHGVWGMFDAKFPDLRSQEQRLAGVTVEKSQAMPFTNAAGVTFRGGYIPIKYDPRANPKAEALAEKVNLDQAKRGLFGRAKTRDSMLKATAETTGMKLRLDEGVLFQGIEEANHRLSHQDVLTDLSKILTHKGMADTITKNHGIDAYNLIRDTLTDVASPSTKDDLGGFSTVLRHLRTGVPAAAFGFNAMRAFLDMAESLPQAAVRVGPARLAAATAKMLGSAARFESFAKSIAAKSAVMADRQRTSLRGANDAFKGARFAGKIREGFDHLAQAVMHRAHLFTDHIVWQAAYDQAVVQFPGDEAKAIAVADSITQDTQSSGRAMDLSKFQRGGEIAKMFTVAYGFFGSVYQLQKVAAVRGLSKPTPGSVARMFADYVCIYSLPIAIDMALKGALKGAHKDQDGKALATDFALEHLAFFLGTVPVARDLGGSITSAFGYGGPAGERGIGALYSLVQHSSRALRDTVEGKESHVGAAIARDALQAGGILFHLPATQIDRSIAGTAYAMEHSQNPILPFLTGKPAH